VEETRMPRLRILFVLSALTLLLGCSKESENPATGANTSETSSSPQTNASGTINEYGGSLIIAASKGDMPAVKLLLAKGSPVSETDKATGSNPLFEAIWIDNLEMVKLLVEHGANVNAKLNNGKSMLDVAKTKGRSDIIALLESKGAKSATVNDYQGSLIIAVSRGDMPAVKLLLAKGSPVSETDRATGSNPLFEAIWIDNLEMVELLVEHGANVNAKMNDGKTILDFAKIKGQSDIIAFLQSKGAK
jgi:ankyrin repeat protein